MTVPVRWISMHMGEVPVDVIPRGYFDQGWLEALTAGELWVPPGFPTFDHAAGDLSVLPSDGGAVVALPARWHCSTEDVERLSEALGRLSWLILVLCGDEEGTWPVERFAHPNRRIIIQTPHATNRAFADRVIGDWWPPLCRQWLTSWRGSFYADLEANGWHGGGWFFAGNINNERRVECLRVLRQRQSVRGDGLLKPTRVFGSGYEYGEYIHLMMQAKVIPCPSGCFSPDSFRVYEALEAGCVPVVDRSAPRTPDETDYWHTLFHSPPPFPILNQWADFDGVCDQILGDWQAWANRCGSWWEQEKRAVAWDLLDDLREVGAL